MSPDPAKTIQNLLQKTLTPVQRALRQLVSFFARHHGLARRRCRFGADQGDLLAWGKKFLSAHFTKPPSNMHRWMARKFSALQKSRALKINLLGPRGAAKSTIATLAFPLREALEGRESYIWIVSDTKHQACAHLDNIKAELLENKLLNNEYPHAAGRGPVWRSNVITLRNGVTIEAFGAGQRIRGRRYRQHRPTLIICDDLQNDGHILSARLRSRSRDWFHAMLMNAGTNHTNIVNLATALHTEALAVQLHSTPGWSSYIFRSIADWPQNMSLWQQWENIYLDSANPRYKADARKFYDDHRPDMDRGSSVLWPDHENLYSLMCMRAESGHTAFEREKQNSPVNPELCEWPDSYFDESIWFDDWPKNPILKTMAIDPSKGADARRGDYSAIVMLSVDRHGIIYVDADLKRRPASQIVADGVEWFRLFRPDVFGIEANQFQDLFHGEFESRFRRQGLLDARPYPLENTTNKMVRIRRLGQYLSGRRIKFKNRSPGALLLVDQLRQFPIADHDDGPDAAEMALRLAHQLLAGRQIKDPLGARLPVG